MKNKLLLLFVIVLLILPSAIAYTSDYLYPITYSIADLRYCQLNALSCIFLGNITFTGDVHITGELLNISVHTYIINATNIVGLNETINLAEHYWNETDTESSNFITTGNVTADYHYGNGSQLTNLPNPDLSDYIKNGTDVNFSSIELGDDMPGEDIFIYFNHDANHDQYIKWDDSDNWLVVSGNANIVQTLYSSDIVTGVISTSRLGSTGDIFTTGAGDDIWLGSLAQADSKLRASTNGYLAASNILIEENGLGSSSSKITHSNNMVFNSQVIGTDNFEFQNGNIGVGTANPGAKVEVVGDILATSVNASWNGSKALEATIQVNIDKKLQNGTSEDAVLRDIIVHGNVTQTIGKSYKWSNGASITVEADGDMVFRLGS